MTARFSDIEIDTMLQARKPLPDHWRSIHQLKEKRGHKERELIISGDDENEYRIILRQSNLNPLDFSVILAVVPAATNVLFRLRRYNGKSHEHSNQLEQMTFYDFHIHTATARYQDLGMREDSFAESTDRYSNILGAFQCLVADANLVMPAQTQGDLFGTE